jgi:multiple sugar transport system permease protein
MMAEQSVPRSATKMSQLSRKEIRKILTGVLFISPWLVGFLWLTVYPLFASLYYSFTDYQILADPNWIGIQNYKDMFADALFWTSVVNTLYYVVVSVTFGTLFSIMLALLLNLKVRGMSIYRTAYYIPNVVPAVASVMLWAWILHPTAGPINFVLSLLHISGPNWFGDPNYTKPALIIIGLWGLGGSTIIYLAGLQDIPVHLYESAELDGANAIDRTLNITLPLLTPTILFNIVMALINGFQYFTQAFVGSGLSSGPGYANTGGPLNSMLFYNLYLYTNAFGYFKMGYASAMAWVLLVFVLVVTLLVFRLTGKMVQYGR